MIQRCCLVLITLVLAVNADERPVMSSIDVNVHESITLPLGETVKIKLVTSSVGKLKTALKKVEGVIIDEVKNDGVRLKLASHHVLKSKAKAMYSLPSFVVDYEEKNTINFVSGYLKSENESEAIDSMVKYVSEYILDTNYSHGFKIASKVADQRSGDCTEFSVLTASLARSHGYPARIVMGVVVIEESATVNAYGHAWVEIFYDDKWHIADAALYDLNVDRLRYIPLSELDIEGPGYALSLIASTALLPKSIFFHDSI